MLPRFSSCRKNSIFLISLLSTAAVLLNIYFYQYPGNNYFPDRGLTALLVLFISYLGSVLQFGRESKISKAIYELSRYFFILMILVYATYAVQYTPFQPIDKYILKLEYSFHIHLESILDWTSAHPVLKTILSLAYDSLMFQIILLPLLVILAGKYELLNEHYFLFLISVLLGFSFYYFFPTTAPASMLDSPHFLAEQKDTGLKFYQIHQHIKPSTMDGGLIALPSYHTIWGWFCLYLMRGWPLVFAILLPINALLIASCVLLGWHYVTDLIGALMVILASHGLFYVCKRQQKKPVWIKQEV